VDSAFTGMTGERGTRHSRSQSHPPRRTQHDAGIDSSTCSQPQSKILQTDQVPGTDPHHIPTNTHNYRPEQPKSRKRAPRAKRADKRRRQPERAARALARAGGVRSKWGSELENGKEVVADATLSHDAIPRCNATEGRSCTFCAVLVATHEPEQMHEAKDRMLCHNICRLIRVVRELDVEVTFDGERESTRPLHLKGLSAHSRILPLTCQYIYLKCT
jgi:hypothetical protein